MTISGIASSSYYSGQMSTMRSGAAGAMSGQMGPMAAGGNRPDPAAVFEKSDEDGSGGLNQTEFEELADKISEATGEEVDVAELYSIYDEDGDGELSQEETDAVMADNRPAGPPPGGGMGGAGPMQGGGPPPDLSGIVEELDEDGDGILDETEAEQLAEFINNATAQELDVESLLEAYDEDGDGTLSESEAMTALEENRPDSPPPPPDQTGMNESDTTTNLISSAIENYMKMAALGDTQTQTTDLFSILG